MNKLKLSREEIGNLCLELSILLHAGVGVGDGLSLLAEDAVPDSPYRAMLEEMSRRSDDGLSAAEVFQEAGCFPKYLCDLLQVGEQTGRIEESLAALARYYEDQSRLTQRIKTALLYPAILLIIMLAVIVVLLVKVLPVFDSVYAQLGSSLTGVAGGLLTLGKAMGSAMPVLCVLLGIVVVLLACFALSDGFRAKLLSGWNRRWGDKGVSRKLSTARFAQSLSMCLSSGLPIEDALTLSSSMLEGSGQGEERCRKCLALLDEGAPLAKAMGESELLPHTECRLLDTGMRSGMGDTVMEDVSRRLSEQSEMALEAKVGQVEPALVVITSVLVGLILLSVMLPLMNIMAAIG